MATKTEIKKWIKEITTPLLKPYGYKFGPVKEFGNALAFYKKTDIDFAYIGVSIYRDHELQFGGIHYVNLKLVEKLFEITNDKEIIRYGRIMYIPETHPYYEYVKKRDFTYRQIITSKEQLQDYLQPLLDQFDRNVELVKHYKYIPNLLQKWEEVQAIHEKIGNYEIVNLYFPSPYKYFFVYYLARLVNYKNSNNIFNYSISIMEMIRKEIIDDGDIEGSKEYDGQIQSMHKIKTYFDTISKEEFTQLQEEFAPFLIDPKTDVSDIV